MAFTFSTTPSYDNQMLASGSGADEIGIYTTLTGPASYTTGGESFVVARDLGLSAIKHFDCELNDNGTNVRWLTYDRTNTKIRAWKEQDVTETDSGTETSTVRESIEEANGTNLSTITYRVRILGTRKNFSS